MAGPCSGNHGTAANRSPGFPRPLIIASLAERSKQRESENGDRHQRSEAETCLSPAFVIAEWAFRGRSRRTSRPNFPLGISRSSGIIRDMKWTKSSKKALAARLRALKPNPSNSYGGPVPAPRFSVLARESWGSEGTVTVPSACRKSHPKLSDSLVHRGPPVNNAVPFASRR